jgi:hypothetical protein
MTGRSVQDVLPVLQEMQKLELGLAALYQACGERFSEDQEFWFAIQKQEERHAQIIERLAGLIAAHPELFRAGRAFNATAIKTILASIAGYTAQVRDGTLSNQRAKFVARDIENSVLEASYAEIVTTDNLEFRQAMELMAKDTLAHKKAFVAAVAKGSA